MKKVILLSCICLQALQLSAQKKYPAETLQKIEEVENNITGNIVLNDNPPNTITERMAKYNVKGLSIAVIHDYKIDWAKGYGWADESEKRKVTTETLFEPGSISKSLNAIGILKLAQEQKIDLYTDINIYLKSWKFPYDSISKGKKINLAQILSHNAGLSVYGFSGYTINGDIPSLIQVLDGKAPATTPPVRSIFEPGLKFQYSGGGIAVSQLLLTDVTGRKYDAWMYDNVLKPIGMVNSSFEQPPSKGKQKLCATGYYSDGSQVFNKYRVYAFQAVAGLWTTPTDLSNYIIDLQLAYHGKSSKVITKEMADLHLDPYNSGPSALGTFYDDRGGARYFFHDASNEGFCGLFVGSLDSGDGVVVFMNSGDGRLLVEVLNSVAKAYGWKNYYHEPQRKRTAEIINVHDSTLKNYEGIYLYDQTWAAVGKKDKDYFFYAENTPVKMYFTTPECFFNEEFSAVKKFRKDGNGNITGYSRSMDGKEFPGAVKILNPDTVKLNNSLFADIGWYFLENKNYHDAISYYRRGVQLYPEDLNLVMNLAHAYVLNNDYKSAVTIYKAHQEDSIRKGFSWENQMQSDLMYFKEHNYKTTLFDKIFSELKINIPKGYEAKKI
ncbi:MAG: serine hydrolase [Chitinophagaceae bacterium]|jgi:CubicO group peptidase (beta-lactamase class C family)